jgi:hypothetical protein
MEMAVATPKLQVCGGSTFKAGSKGEATQSKEIREAARPSEGENMKAPKSKAPRAFTSTGSASRS